MKISTREDKEQKSIKKCIHFRSNRRLWFGKRKEI